MKYFADISNNQGNAVRPDEINADAVILKASEGAGFTDGYRATWQAGLEARGIPCGTYHFHRASATPAAQLQRWIDSGLDTGQLRPVLDCEDTAKTVGPDAMAANCLELADLVANHCGVAPVIYTGGWWLGTYATRDPAWAGYDLWLAAYPLSYTRQPTDAEAATWLDTGKYCSPPAPWPEITAWQYTSIAEQPGIPGGSDRSIVTDDAFARLFRNTTPTTLEDFMAALTDDEQRRLLGNTDKLWSLVSDSVAPAVGRIELAEYIEAHAGNVDVDALAKKLSATLGADVAKALGQKLAG